MTRNRQVHSPEHVLIELRPAGLGSRLGAFALDAAILAGAVGLLQLAGRLLPDSVAGLLVTTADFLVLWGYHVVFEVLWNGQTPGKRILGLRVVDGRGLPIQAAQSLVRNVVRIVDMIPSGGIGMLAALTDSQHRRLGDRAADTLVVDERQPGTGLLQSLGSRRFNTLRSPRLQRLIRHRIGLDERELLFALCLRGEGLTERARFELFEEVGNHYRAALGIEEPSLSGESVVRGIAAVCAGSAAST